ncbi:MAG: RseA family anti-sigma factor [Gammaproteobacteria bacterium]|tara:strand:- start:333 stop:1022 length:690 start_codon:yes stop_codon:yes gene_type:complete
MNEIEIGEKLSALHDGELESSEIDELIDLVSKDTQLQKKLSFYSVMGMAANYESNNVVKIKSKKTKNIFSNLWLSNAMTAAASILLTLIFLNDNDFSRMNVDSKSFDQITSAINSKEAKNIAKQSEEYLTDHIMRIINDPSFMISNSNNIDLRNVGYKTNAIQGLGYSKGDENFQLRLEKKDFTLNSIKYWKHGNKMIYLVPMKDGRTLTLYGNISLSTAMTVAKSLNL